MADFAAELLAFVSQTRSSTVAMPNIDGWRFGPTPNAFARFTEGYLQDGIAFLAANAEAIRTAARLFCDDWSRDLLKLLYAYRFLGPGHVLLPTNTPRYWQNYRTAESWRIGPSETVIQPFEFGCYSGTFRGQPVELECWLGNVVFSFLADQYFFARDGIIIEPAAGDAVIDGGGCFGDTALAFAIAVGQTGKVHSVEPMPYLGEVFKANVRRNPGLADRIDLADGALWDASGQVLAFGDLSAGSRPVDGGAIRVSTLTIDDLVRARNLRKVDFIKLDVEGSERQALAGAAETIGRFAPKLAISAYHRPDDLLVLPALIKEIEPRYQLFLEHYTIYGEESIIFATL